MSIKIVEIQTSKAPTEGRDCALLNFFSPIVKLQHHANVFDVLFDGELSTLVYNGDLILEIQSLFSSRMLIFSKSLWKFWEAASFVKRSFSRTGCMGNVHGKPTKW